MARLQFALFAERVSVDRFNNALDVHNVLEQLHVPEPTPSQLEAATKAKKPLVARGRLVLVVHWRRSVPDRPEGSYTSKVDLVGPNGKVLSTATQVFTLREHIYMRTLVGYDALPVIGPGTYSARVAIKVGKRWTKVGEASIQLSYQKQPQPGERRRIQVH